MEKEGIRKGTDYHTYFDSDWFLKNSFANLDDNSFRPFGKFMFDSVCKIFKSGEIYGRRMIDIGSGPSIHMAIPACKWFDEIILTDFTEGNREFITKWLKGQPDAYNWEHFFRYCAKMDNNVTEWQAIEKEVRAKVKEVLPCDINVDSVLSTDMMGKFDCVTSSLVLESVAENLEHYRKCFANQVHLLKPGGHLILCGLLKRPPGYYMVGKETFWGMPLQKEDVFSAAEMTGVEKLYYLEQKVHRDKRFGHLDAAYVFVARKKTPDSV